MYRLQNSPVIRDYRTQSAFTYKQADKVFCHYYPAGATERPSLPTDTQKLPDRDVWVIQLTPTHILQIAFRMLVDEWRSGTKFMSLSDDIISHPAYRAIVALGQPVIPLILKEMERQPGHWFAALEELTGHHPHIPPEDAGNIKKLTEAWLRM